MLPCQSGGSNPGAPDLNPDTLCTSPHRHLNPTFTGLQVAETPLRVGYQDILAPMPALPGWVVGAQAVLLPSPTGAGTFTPGGPGVPGAVDTRARLTLAQWSICGEEERQ